MKSLAKLEFISHHVLFGGTILAPFLSAFGWFFSEALSLPNLRAFCALTWKGMAHCNEICAYINAQYCRCTFRIFQWPDTPLKFSVILLVPASIIVSSKLGPLSFPKIPRWGLSEIDPSSVTRYFLSSFVIIFDHPGQQGTGDLPWMDQWTNGYRIKVIKLAHLIPSTLSPSEFTCRRLGGT